MSDTTTTEQILVTRQSPEYWRVTINHPPLNIFGPDTIPALNEAVTASFDKRAISETKRFVDVASLPSDYEIASEWDVCFASIMRPAAQERIKKLMEQGFQKPGDVENRLGYHVG